MDRTEEKDSDNTVEPLLTDPLGGVTISWLIEMLGNKKSKITGVNGVGRVGLKSDK